MEQPRRGLGKGAGALFSSPVAPVSPAPIASKGEGFILLSVSEISANPLQPRKFFDQQKIEELAQSIKEKGILQPVIVTRKNGKYELVSGERRFRAALAAGLKEIPAMIREAEPAEVLELAIIENVQREDLDPIEEAAAYRELMDRFGYTQETVAAKVGKDRATVGNVLRLLKLPTKLRQALQSGELSMGHARALLGVAEIERQLYFADRVAQEGWSVRELETRIASKKPLSAARKKSASLPPKLAHLVDEMRRKLGTQVKLVPSGQKGKIIIEYYSEVDLDRVYQALVK
jgi:ParB family chromosome partitioning protein